MLLLRFIGHFYAHNSALAVSRDIEFVQSYINIPGHPEPLIRKDEPLVLFICSAAPISFSTAFFRMSAIFLRFDTSGMFASSWHHRPMQ
jgi:hypothetical protein